MTLMEFFSRPLKNQPLCKKTLFYSTLSIALNEFVQWCRVNGLECFFFS